MKAAVVATILFVASSAWAEDIAPVRSFRSFDRQSTAGGLPQASVTALFQDEDGRLWIGTLDGLATFDGTRMLAVREAGAPTSAPVLGFARRQAGGLWIAGSRGVTAWDGVKFTTYPATSPLTRVTEAADGTLWCLEQSGGVLLRRPDGPFTRWNAPQIELPVVGLVSAPEGVLVVGRERVVLAVGGRPGPPLCGRLPAPLTSFLRTRAGTLVAGTTNGQLYACADGGESWKPLFASPWDAGLVRALGEDARGRVWAGGNNGRVAFGRPGESFTHWGPENGLRGTAVVSLLGDREGTVWIGFNGKGLQQWVGEAFSHRTRWEEKDPFSDTLQVFGLAETQDGGFLAAVYNRGIWRWDEKARKMKTLGREAGLTEDVRFAIEPEPGVVWAAGRFGIYESRGGKGFKKTFDLPQGFVNAILRAPDGTWTATTSTAGLATLGAKGWQLDETRNRFLADRNVRGLAWLPNGETWIASLNGLTVLKADGSPVSPDRIASIPLKQFNAILPRWNGEVWLGGFGGIAILRPDGRSTLLTERDGMPGTTIYALEEGAGGTIWIGGSAGLARLSGPSGPAVALGREVSLWDARNGFIDDEINLYGLLLRHDGTVLAGTMASLACFDPSVGSIPAPPIHLRLVSPPSRDGRVVLPPRRRELSLAWSAPWLRPVPVEFRSRLPQLSNEWSAPSGKSELSIPFIGAGTHPIEIQARLGGPIPGEWTEPLVVTVTVSPRWWETAWARAAGVLLAVLLVVGIVRAATRRLSKRAEILDAEVARRTTELVEANSQLREAQAALRDQALKDVLTGVYNRRAADERLDELFSNRTRRPSAVAILLFDVDYLKQTNDRLGHAAGDELLRRLAELAKRSLREGDILARYGGDEFLAIFPEGDEESATSFAERLRAAARSGGGGPGDVPLSFSGGAAAVAAEGRGTSGDLLRAADKALYAAKDAGKDRVVRASEIARVTPAPASAVG